MARILGMFDLTGNNNLLVHQDEEKFIASDTDGISLPFLIEDDEHIEEPYNQMF